MTDLINDEKAIIEPGELDGKKTKPVPMPDADIGVDTDQHIYEEIILAGDSSHLDISKIEEFTRVSQKRDEVYALLDSMCNDATIAAVLETYAEDSTERSEEGKIVWAEASDSKVSTYVNYLLASLGIDKNVYRWVYSLCKYGDLYIRLYRESEISNDAIFGSLEKDDGDKEETIEPQELQEGKQQLNEDVKVKIFPKKDKYSNYIEMEANPAEIFELTKFGKTAGYIKAPVPVSQEKSKNDLLFPHYIYQFKLADVNVYGPLEYVHCALEDNTSRSPEEVQIFTSDKEEELKENVDETAYKYTVKRGQSLFYNIFKIWRELSLLENAILLNRVTKSAIVRLINVQVGDMAKEDVPNVMRRIKQLIEQKAAINKDVGMSEYTNPGPIENNIYIPVHGETGNVTIESVGGDVDAGKLTDLEYFRDKLFGALRVPKQYYGFVGDNAGFSGGESLAIISSRYAKMIKRIQAVVCQGVTDIINLYLLNRNLDSYVNKFKIKMQPPTTSEDIDRRDNLSSKVQITGDIMNLMSDIEDQTAKLKMLKSLLSNVITNDEVIGIIQDVIDKLEEEGSTPDLPTGNEEGGGLPDLGGGRGSAMSAIGGIGGNGPGSNEPGGPEEEVSIEAGEEEVGGSNPQLPSPSELGIGDLSDNDINA